MDFDRLNRWLTLVANVGILLGLILVILEINQNSQIARASLINEGNNGANQIWSTLMSGSANESIARAVECPAQMSYADYMVFDTYLFASFNNIYRDYQLSQEDLYTEEEWRTSVEAYAHWYLGNPIGAVWWRKVGRTFFADEFVDHVDATMANVAGKDSYAVWSEIRAELLGPNAGPGPNDCAGR
jgi:hypothetical protein